FGYCVEVFERYPGLCRCLMNWGHMPHGVLAALAAIDDSRARALYGRLRDVYNPSHSSTSLPAPRWEEWRGMSTFCDTFQCSLYGGMITTIAGQGSNVFSNLPHDTSDCTGSRRTHCTDDHLQPVGEENKSNNMSACVTPENATGSIMDAPCSNSDKSMASTSSWQSHQEPAPQISRPPRSSSSTSHVRRGLGRVGASDSEVLNSAVDGSDGDCVLSGLEARVPD
ncbi:unnamed protein product, partial [Ectocarpus sp. 6 AP-2014]